MVISLGSNTGFDSLILIMITVWLTAEEKCTVHICNRYQGIEINTIMSCTLWVAQKHQCTVYLVLKVHSHVHFFKLLCFVFHQINISGAKEATSAILPFLYKEFINASRLVYCTCSSPPPPALKDAQSSKVWSADGQHARFWIKQSDIKPSLRSLHCAPIGQTKTETQKLVRSMTTCKPSTG